MFSTDPDLFILDEPTIGMDVRSRNEFYKLLKHNSTEHDKGILMVTHDHEEIRHYANKHIELIRKEDSPWRCFLWIDAKSFPSFIFNLINHSNIRIVFGIA